MSLLFGSRANASVRLHWVGAKVKCKLLIWPALVRRYEWTQFYPRCFRHRATSATRADGIFCWGARSTSSVGKFWFSIFRFNYLGSDSGYVRAWWLGRCGWFWYGWASMVSAAWCIAVWSAIARYVVASIYVVGLKIAAGLAAWVKAVCGKLLAWLRLGAKRYRQSFGQ